MKAMRVMLDTTPNMILVLNKWRQIVFANQAASGAVGKTFEDFLCGLRPGEALGCINAGKGPGGCGTSEFCRVCGAVNAIMVALRGGSDVRECRIVRDASVDALDLRVWATPLALDDEPYTALAVVDISDEKRRAALERIFFHDVMNTAVGLRGFADLLEEASPEDMEEFRSTICDLSERLIGEIEAQRELSLAERGEVSVEATDFDAAVMIEAIVRAYEKHDVARDRSLVMDASTEHVTIRSDERLLGRVVGNMVKNALESTEPGGTVSVGCREENGRFLLWVHNPAVMPRNVQLQLFQRSFSTKGTGRGLGTYSMRLISERYLGGKVTFTSAEGEGTTFRAVYPLELRVSGDV